MSKEEMLKSTGTVIETLPNGFFIIKLSEINKEIRAYLSGKIRQNKIKILKGDKVEVEISPYDLSKGRITRRLS